MTPAPFVGLLHVDPSRVGGAFGVQRHAFGMAAQAPSDEFPGTPPPPRRVVLAEGPMSPPRLSQASVEEIRTALGAVADALEIDLDVLKAEADMVSPETLRTQTDLYKSIPVVGPYLTPQEIRAVVMLTAEAAGAAARRVLGGAGSPYVSADQRAKLETVASDADALSAYLKQLDFSPLGGGKSQLAEDHRADHLGAAVEALEAVERRVVSEEAPAVPVEEPAGKGSTLGAILALGALVAVGIIIAEVA